MSCYHSFFKHIYLLFVKQNENELLLAFYRSLFDNAMISAIQSSTFTHRLVPLPLQGLHIVLRFVIKCYEYLSRSTSY